MKINFTKAELKKGLFGYDAVIDTFPGTSISIHDLINGTSIQLNLVLGFAYSFCEFSQPEKILFIKGIVEIVIDLNSEAQNLFYSYSPPITRLIQNEFILKSQKINMFIGQWDLIREIFLEAQNQNVKGNFDEEIYLRNRAFHQPCEPDYLKYKADAVPALVPDYTDVFDDVNGIFSYIIRQNALLAVYYLYVLGWTHSIPVVTTICNSISENGNKIYLDNLKSFANNFII